MESVVNLVQEKLIIKNDFPTFSSGDTITVYYEIREGDKVRTQSFKGVVIQIKGRGESKTFTQFLENVKIEHIDGSSTTIVDIVKPEPLVSLQPPRASSPRLPHSEHAHHGSTVP